MNDFQGSKEINNLKISQFYFKNKMKMIPLSLQQQIVR